MNPFITPEWMKAQECLKESMHREINLMREMLSSLYQEESFLLEKDTCAWNSLMEDRAHMIEKLKEFREGRDLAVKTLAEFSIEEEGKGITLDTILSDEEEVCEITLMLDQLMALTDKINKQNSRNHSLSEQQFLMNQEKAFSYPDWGIPIVPIRKIALMTLQKKIPPEE